MLVIKHLNYNFSLTYIYFQAFQQLSKKMLHTTNTFLLSKTQKI